MKMLSFSFDRLVLTPIFIGTGVIIAAILLYFTIPTLGTALLYACATVFLLALASLAAWAIGWFVIMAYIAVAAISEEIKTRKKVCHV